MNAVVETNKTLGLGIVGLIVRDLAASLAFYRQLGLDIPTDADEGSYYRMQFPSGQIFFWDTYEVARGYDPDWEPSSGHRRVVLEFGFPTPDAVDAKHAELVSADILVTRATSHHLAWARRDTPSLKTRTATKSACATP